VSKDRRDFALGTFIVTVLAWLFPDPLSRLLSSRVPVQVASRDTLQIAVQETVLVRESIVLTPKTGRLTLSGRAALVV
jgi:hypothetical protein